LAGAAAATAQNTRRLNFISDLGSYGSKHLSAGPDGCDEQTSYSSHLSWS
jgi:hypothetical protein